MILTYIREKGLESRASEAAASRKPFARAGMVCSPIFQSTEHLPSVASEPLRCGSVTKTLHFLNLILINLNFIKSQKVPQCDFFFLKSPVGKWPKDFHKYSTRGNPNC